MVRAPRELAVALISVLGAGFVRGAQEGIAFPADAGVIDVTAAPYLAKGDGVADDTKVIQSAILDHMAGGILYFPDGTYLVSATLKWAKESSGGQECWGNFTVQGQSAARTVIRLRDGTFTDPGTPGSIMWCGGFGSADWFHNHVKDIAFDVGEGNPGAIGLQFYSNNTGGVRNVRIVSQDGKGAIGLDLSHRDMNGPLLVKDVTVRGFAVGVRTGHSVNSQTFEHVRLEDQTACGFHNDGQAVSIRGLRVAGASLALRNSGHGLMAIVDSVLEGRGAASQGPAIDNAAPLFARGIPHGGLPDGAGDDPRRVRWRRGDRGVRSRSRSSGSSPRQAARWASR